MGILLLHVLFFANQMEFPFLKKLLFFFFLNNACFLNLKAFLIFGGLTISKRNRLVSSKILMHAFSNQLLVTHYFMPTDTGRAGTVPSQDAIEKTKMSLLSFVPLSFPFVRKDAIQVKTGQNMESCKCTTSCRIPPA